MRRLEFYFSIFLLLSSLIICQEAFKLPLGLAGVPGTGLFPFLIGVLLFILSCFYFLKTLRSWRREQEIQLWQGLRWRKVILVFAILFPYALFFEKVGFLISTILFLMSLFQWVDRQRWYWVYFGSIGITLLCYAIFKTWLEIQLPVGFLGI